MKKFSLGEKKLSIKLRFFIRKTQTKNMKNTKKNKLQTDCTEGRLQFILV